MTHQFNADLDKYEARVRLEDELRELDEQDRICDEMIAEVEPALQIILDVTASIDRMDACGAEYPHGADEMDEIEKDWAQQVLELRNQGY
jgi:hypothetical protein